MVTADMRAGLRGKFSPKNLKQILVLAIFNIDGQK